MSNRIRRTSLRAFTLVELMISVAIIGLLASIAIPSFVDYLNKAKESGYPLVFRTIIQGERTFWDRPRVDTAGNSLEQCLLMVPSTNPQLPPIGKKRDWSFNAVNHPSAEALGIKDGVFSYLSLFGTWPNLYPAGVGPRCAAPNTDNINIVKDVGVLSVILAADADGDANNTYFRLNFRFNADGSEWTPFWTKEETTYNFY